MPIPKVSVLGRVDCNAYILGGVFSRRDSEQVTKNLMERKEPPYYLACEHSRFFWLLSGEEQGENACIGRLHAITLE